MIKNNELYYIVAGDAMQKLMNSEFPERKTIPFIEGFRREKIRALLLIKSLSEKEHLYGMFPKKSILKNSLQ